MGPTTAGASFAAANAAMLQGVDGMSTVHVLLSDCLALLGADSAGVLVRSGEHQFELLASSSHDAHELELYQAHDGAGPCVEAIETGRTVEVSGIRALVERWPGFGEAMSRTPFETIHAAPMTWHSHVLGGLNLFWAEPRELSGEERELTQSYADICTLALMQAPHAEGSDVVAERVHAALLGRVAIERAKGVLAETEGLDMAKAFERLVRLSRETSQPLSDVARSILEEIISRP